MIWSDWSPAWTLCTTTPGWRSTPNCDRTSYDPNDAPCARTGASTASAIATSQTTLAACTQPRRVRVVSLGARGAGTVTRDGASVKSVHSRLPARSPANVTRRMSRPFRTTFPDHRAVTSPFGVSKIIIAFAPVVSDKTCFHSGAPGPWARTKTSVRNPKAISPAVTGDGVTKGGMSPPNVLALTLVTRRRLGRLANSRRRQASCWLALENVGTSAVGPPAAASQTQHEMLIPVWSSGPDSPALYQRPPAVSSTATMDPQSIRGW